MIAIISLYIFMIVLSSNVIFKSRNKLNTFFFYNVSYTLYYFIIPVANMILIMSSTDKFGGFTRRISEFPVEKHFEAFIVSSSIYLISLFFYFLLNKNKTSNEIEILNKEDYKFSFNSQKYNILLVFGLVTFLLGLLSEYIIVRSFGGVINALSKAELLRAYGTDRSKYMPSGLLFVNILATISLVGPYLFLLAYRLKKRTFPLLMLCVSFLAAAFYLLFFAGRLPIVLFLICFIFDYVFKKFKKPWISIVLGSIFLMLLLGKLDDLFFYLSYGRIKESDINSIASIINDFSFPYTNLLYSSELNNQFGYRLGVDLFTWIINITPTGILRLIGLNKVESSFTFISNFYDPAGVTLGGVPTDFLTMGLRQFGYTGLILLTLLYMALCSFLVKLLATFDSKYLVVQIRVGLIMFILVPYADLDSMMRNRFDMVLIVLVLFILQRNLKHVIKKEKDKL